jgi:hypothetical protein
MLFFPDKYGEEVNARNAETQLAIVQRGAAIRTPQEPLEG